MQSHTFSADLQSWYVLFTKPHQENRAVENLSAWGVEALAPKLKAREGTNVLHPLFPCYIFARFDPAVMLPKIRFTRGISYVVSFGGIPAIVPDEIIEAICQRMDNRAVVREMETLLAGDPVIIESGPLRDFRGVFEEKLSDNERIKILLTTVAYSARVEVSKYDVRRLTPHCVA